MLSPTRGKFANRNNSNLKATQVNHDLETSNQLPPDDLFSTRSRPFSDKKRVRMSLPRIEEKLRSFKEKRLELESEYGITELKPNNHLSKVFKNKLLD